MIEEHLDELEIFVQFHSLTSYPENFAGIYTGLDHSQVRLSSTES